MYKCIYKELYGKVSMNIIQPFQEKKPDLIRFNAIINESV